MDREETEDTIMILEDTKAETVNEACKADSVLELLVFADALKRNGEEAAMFEEALAQ
jgi:hypothetical protein